MQVVRARGLEIAYQRVGEGPPLVLVHGAADDSRVWQPQLAALGDEFTVVAWDEPGAGRSSDVPADFHLADYATCLAAVIEELGLGPAHVAGHSWGSTVVQELYRHYPELGRDANPHGCLRWLEGFVAGRRGGRTGQGGARDARGARGRVRP